MQVLLHAMQLDHEDDSSRQQPPSRTHTQETKTRYQRVKLSLFALEQSARFSTNLLAASALLALHEIGHGIFPAAYLTVSNLARLFCALGLHDRTKATQILPRPGTYTVFFRLDTYLITAQTPGPRWRNAVASGGQS
jgi:hypothetical protein